MNDGTLPKGPVIPKNRLLPREGDHAEEIGSYGLAIRLHNSVIDPGDTVEVEIFFSGYGQITSSKLVFYTSPNLIDTDSGMSYILTGLDEEEDRKATWGHQRIPIDPTGTALDMSDSGLALRNWCKATSYFDVCQTPLPTIATEQKLRGYAPVHLFLKTKKSARPGMHSLQFLYTYYDGRQWRSYSETIQYTLRSFYQRHEMKVWLLGAIAALLATVIAIHTIVSWF